MNYQNTVIPAEADKARGTQNTLHRSGVLHVPSSTGQDQRLTWAHLLEPEGLDSWGLGILSSQVIYSRNTYEEISDPQYYLG